MSDDAPRPPRALVVCLDGTSNQIGKDLPTNPARLYQMLQLKDPRRQLGYYDPGVGTLPSPGTTGRLQRRLSVLRQDVFGAGLRGNLADAYTWLMRTWLPGDDIYLFGFSRGAYTARALAGMLHSPGLMRPGSENLVPYAVAQYARREDRRDPAETRQFADAFCWGTEHTPVDREAPPLPDGGPDAHSVPVRYVGLWDTVEAAGLAPRGDLRWPYTASLDNVQGGRHAVSLDERRRAFRPYRDLHAPAQVEEVWFAGIHTDVGGRPRLRPPSPRRADDVDHLSRITLRWVVSGAGPSEAADPKGLWLRTGAFDRECEVHPDWAAQPIHRNAWFWGLTIPRARPVPDDARLHRSVRLRSDYAAAYGARLGDVADDRWVEPTWPEG